MDFNSPEFQQLVKQYKHEAWVETMKEVDALLLANWKFELPQTRDPEPFQWYWRSPPKENRKKGRLYLSTTQAFNAMKKEKLK